MSAPQYTPTPTQRQGAKRVEDATSPSSPNCPIMSPSMAPAIDPMIPDNIRMELPDMTTLWPACREYLRRMPLGRCCRNFFNLEPQSVFLNHNAFGTTAKPVLQAQAHFASQMEMHPDRFYRRELPQLLRHAASKLASFVHADADDVVFVTNTTTGMNAVLRSVDLQNDDEVLCLDLTYPSVLNTLRHLCFCTQEFVELKVVETQLPIQSYDALIAQIEAAITPNTRLAVLDHIASMACLVLPLERLVDLFHARGIPVLVDGASAPGQLPLDLPKLGVDFYVGSCYKWLFGSKSCAFLYVSKEFQNTVRPAVTSLNYDQSFVEDFSVQGTRDESNFLSIVTALDFYNSIGFQRVVNYNTSLVNWASDYLAHLWGTEALLPAWQRAPFASNIRLPISLPRMPNGEPLKHDVVAAFCEALIDLLDDRYRVSVRIAPFQDALYIRISAQVYNEKRDFEVLGAAVQELTQTPSLSEHLARLCL